jgi:hypothetical protein
MFVPPYLSRCGLTLEISGINLIAALEHPDRVHEIWIGSLRYTHHCSVWSQEPFRELESVCLWMDDETGETPLRFPIPS